MFNKSKLSVSLFNSTSRPISTTKNDWMFSAEGYGVKLVLFIIMLRNVQNQSVCNVSDPWNIKGKYCDSDLQKASPIIVTFSVIFAIVRNR
jgi:hypothetical protein